MSTSPASLAVGPSLPRSIGRPPLPEIAFPRMTMPVGAEANTAIPAPALFAIVFPSPAAMPPIVALGGVSVAVVRMPSPLFGIAVRPSALVPIRFAFTTTPVESWIRMPSPAFPDTTLPSPAAPIVVSGASSN